MSPTSTRTVTVSYEDATGEHRIEVMVTGDGREANIVSDLSDVPADEIEHVKQWALDEFFSQERAAYVRSGGDPRHDD